MSDKSQSEKPKKPEHTIRRSGIDIAIRQDKGLGPVLKALAA